MLKKIIFLFLLLIITFGLVFYYFNMQVKKKKLDHIMDQLRLTLDAQLAEAKMRDLKTAILISKNQALIDALENDDEDLGYKILSETVADIEKNTRYHIRAQIFTSELNIFARSWDDVYTGMPIGSYRSDLKHFKNHTDPRASIEIGRRVGIKATVPLYKDGVQLGYVEVISFFKNITEFFSSMGVDFYAFLDVKYSDSAVLMLENLAISNYLVANRNYNYSHIQTLKNIDFKELRLSGMLFKDEKYIFYENMHNGDGGIIGGFVFILPAKYFHYFRDAEDDISFLINVTRSNLYDVVKEERYGEKIYENFSAESLVYLQDVIEKEDRELFFDEAYEKFDAYSKDELIQMMLNRKVVKKIDGKIQ